jgi:predicted amidohydrolase
VGTDGNGISYSGDSSVFGPLGELLWQQSGTEAIHSLVLEREQLLEARRQFPFLADADSFVLM